MGGGGGWKPRESGPWARYVMWRLAASVRRRAPWEGEGPGEAGTRAGRALLTPSRSSSLAPFVAGAGILWDQKEMEKWFREQKGWKESLVLNPD